MDEREDTMDEREVHTSLVNIAYSGASTRNNIIESNSFEDHKHLCPNIRPRAVIRTHNGFNFCINFLSAQGAFSVKYGIW